ncbi:SET and MYND domain containing class 4 member 1 [Carabus blaptoides fortunei]
MDDIDLDVYSSLTSLIVQYNTDIKYIESCDEEIIFRSFFNNCNRNITLEWLDKVFVNSTSKCAIKAKAFREDGNVYYKEKNYLYALRHYTESVSHAPYDHEEFSLALSNRSAVLYNLNEYQSCVQDLETCLQTNYPKDLFHKLYLRLASCYVKLHVLDKSVETLQKLKDYLKDEQLDISPSKRDSVLQDINGIEKDISSKNSVENSDECINKEELNKLPDLKGGQNPKFLFASNALDLLYNPLQGRHVMANQDIQVGDVLFVEKPFSFVPILKSSKNSKHVFEEKCYNCLRTAKCPLPCKNCTTLYCAAECRDVSWSRYHRWECPGSCVDIWTKIGVNFLALRLLLIGASSGFTDVTPEPDTDVHQFGNAADNYPYICKLKTNVEKMDKMDVLPHVVSAMMITLYLKEKTDFFSHLKTAQNMDTFVYDELVYKVGGLLLKHILQVIVNASTVEAVHDEFYSKFHQAEQVTDNGIYVHAVGMYPSVSMMNHSCNTNIANYFCDDVIVVKANRNISKGEEIFNSYGLDCRRTSTQERQNTLKKQHYFICQCGPCTYPTKPEIYKGFLCQKCKGCSLTIAEEKYKCLSCQHEFAAGNHFTYLVKGEKYYEKFENTGNIEYLKRCIELREKVLHKYNYALYTVYLDLQMYYGDKGEFLLWWYYAQITLDMDKELIGEHSLRYAMNMRFSLIIIIRYLLSLDIQNKNMISGKDILALVCQSNKMLIDIKNIFKLYYSEEKLDFSKLSEEYDDMVAVTTRVLKDNLVEDIDSCVNELCEDFKLNV